MDITIKVVDKDKKTVTLEAKDVKTSELQVLYKLATETEQEEQPAAIIRYPDLGLEEEKVVEELLCIPEGSRCYKLYEVAEKLKINRTTLANWMTRHRKYLPIPEAAPGRRRVYVDLDIKILSMLVNMKQENRPDGYVNRKLKEIDRVKLAEEEEPKQTPKEEGQLKLNIPEGPAPEPIARVYTGKLPKGTPVLCNTICPRCAHEEPEKPIIVGKPVHCSNCNVELYAHPHINGFYKARYFKATGKQKQKAL